MTALRRAVAVFGVLGSLAPVVAGAQESQPVPADGKPGPWVVFGGASTTLLGDCEDCAGDTYMHSGGAFAQGGVALNRRADLGGELFWVYATIPSGDHVRAVFLMATVQFRPWQTRGFFLKGGAGIAFVRNWLKVFEEAPPSESKALGIEVGAGWEWRRRSHIGLQVFGGHHVAALGDLETSERTLENVVGNVWSIGAAIVIR
jgi:hypothetical protein